MPDIQEVLESALRGEPNYTPNLEALFAEGQHRQRRRRILMGGSIAGVGSGIAALALVLVATDPPSAPHRDAAAPALKPTAVESSAPPADVRLTKDTLTELVEQLGDVRLAPANVDVLPPLGDIDLGAGIASAQGQYLNVQVTPAGTSSVRMPTCADFSGSGRDGDGYTGPCSVTRRPDGGYLVVRSGRTTNDRYAKTEAGLVTGDGATIWAETTNQIAGTDLGAHKVGPDTKPPRIEPAVSDVPPLTSDQLRSLVLALNDRR